MDSNPIEFIEFCRVYWVHEEVKKYKLTLLVIVNYSVKQYVKKQSLFSKWIFSFTSTELTDLRTEVKMF